MHPLSTSSGVEAPRTNSDSTTACTSPCAAAYTGAFRHHFRIGPPSRARSRVASFGALVARRDGRIGRPPSGIFRPRKRGSTLPWHSPAWQGKQAFRSTTAGEVCSSNGPTSQNSVAVILERCEFICMMGCSRQALGGRASRAHQHGRAELWRSGRSWRFPAPTTCRGSWQKCRQAPLPVEPAALHHSPPDDADRFDLTSRSAELCRGDNRLRTRIRQQRLLQPEQRRQIDARTL